MTNMAGEEGGHVLRWLEEGQTVIDDVRRLLRQCAQFKGVAEAAQQECERLQRNCEELREEVRLVKTENERLKTEQADMTQWFATMMKDATVRFRIEPPSA